jgi:F0F1-type ATP synthase membrane subunit b/b'
VNYELVALWSEVVSAIMFVIALVLVWNKWIQPSVIAAQRNTNARIAEAERHRDEAKASLGGLQDAIIAAQRDAAAIKMRVEAQAKSECERIVADSREAGERAVRSAQGELERARASARVRLRDELLDRAVAIARARARERVDDAMNRKLLASFVGTLERHRGK